MLQYTYSSHASYDDIWHSFLEESKKHTSKADESRFLGWCSNFNAGSIDSITHLLPPRSVESSQAGELHKQASKQQQDSYRQARKRRRNFSCLVNSIVFHLPSEPWIVYVALGGK